MAKVGGKGLQVGTEFDGSDGSHYTIIASAGEPPTPQQAEAMKKLMAAFSPVVMETGQPVLLQDLTKPDGGIRLLDH